MNRTLKTKNKNRKIIGFLLLIIFILVNWIAISKVDLDNVKSECDIMTLRINELENVSRVDTIIVNKEIIKWVEKKDTLRDGSDSSGKVEGKVEKKKDSL